MMNKPNAFLASALAQSALVGAGLASLSTSDSGKTIRALKGDIEHFVKKHTSSSASPSPVTVEVPLSDVNDVYSARSTINDRLRSKLNRGAKDSWLRSHEDIKESVKAAPSPPLVGVEPNPGPPKRAKGKKKGGGGGARASMNVTRPKRGPVMVRASAPVSQSMLHQTHMRYSGASYKGKSGVKINGHQRYCSVWVQNNIPTLGFGASVQRKLITPSQLPAPLGLLGISFMRFRFTKLQFYYSPIVSTAQNGFVVIGYTSDSNATATPSASTIATLDNCMEGPLWSNISLNSSLDGTDDLYYCYRLDQEGMDRFQSQGVFLLSGSTSGLANQTQIADIWLSYEVEFYELGDTQAVQLSLNRHVALETAAHVAVESSRKVMEEEKKREEEKYLSIRSSPESLYREVIPTYVQVDRGRPYTSSGTQVPPPHPSVQQASQRLQSL